VPLPTDYDTHVQIVAGAAPKAKVDHIGKFPARQFSAAHTGRSRGRIACHLYGRIPDRNE